jgi:hypothetical protein
MGHVLVSKVYCDGRLRMRWRFPGLAVGIEADGDLELLARQRRPSRASATAAVAHLRRCRIDVHSLLKAYHRLSDES